MRHERSTVRLARLGVIPCSSSARIPPLKQNALTTLEHLEQVTTRHTVLLRLDHRSSFPRQPDRLLPQLCTRRFSTLAVLAQVGIRVEEGGSERVERGRRGTGAEESGVRGEAAGEGDDSVG